MWVGGLGEEGEGGERCVKWGSSDATRFNAILIFSKLLIGVKAPSRRDCCGLIKEMERRGEVGMGTQMKAPNPTYLFQRLNVFFLVPGKVDQHTELGGQGFVVVLVVLAVVVVVVVLLLWGLSRRELHGGRCSEAGEARLGQLLLFYVCFLLVQKPSARLGTWHRYKPSVVPSTCVGCGVTAGEL